VFFNRQSAYPWVNCAPHLANLLLYSYEADFIPVLLNKSERKVTRSFNYTFRYIDDVLSLKVEHVDDVSFGEPFAKIRVVFNKLNLSLPRVRNSCAGDREVQCFNDIAGGT
jgi:hypothetical protein